MIEALRLDELGTLDRSRLHIFVVGPGVGEAIAVALPARDWFLLDGCTTSGGQVPVLEIWDRWRRMDDRVAGYMLTHPHNDHALGAARIIERTDPARISVGPLDILRQEAGGVALADSTSGLRLGQAVRSALVAVDTWFARHPDGLIETSAGSAWPMERAEVLITQRAPLQITIDWLRDTSAAGVFPSEQANRGSTVLELEFGRTRVVLGGDLPSFASAQDRESRRPLAGGWADVLTARANLGAHTALKVPHHGSDEAIHEGLMPMGTERAWITTPFNTGGKALPSLAAMGGLAWMVHQNGLVHLTSPPASRQAPIRISASGRVLLQELTPFGGERKQHEPRMNDASHESVAPKMQRQFTASEKLRLVKAADLALASGERGALEALLRKEAIYSSQLAAWRQQLGTSGEAGLTSRKPGRKPKLGAAGHALLAVTKQNETLQRKLRVANALIALQKKMHELLGLTLPELPEEN